MLHFGCLLATWGSGHANDRADLYNVLLDEKGGHFRTHHDIEKESGIMMFGTLVV